MPDNVAASMTASIVLDKSDLLAQILKGLSEGQKELQNNKLEMYFDFSNSKNQAEFEKVIQKYRKQLSSQEFVVQIKDQGIDETVKSLDKLVEVVKSLASGKAFGTGSGNGKGIGNSIVDEKQLKTVINLFEKMESHLSSMRKVISDVGDGDEFSPLLTMINKVDSSISELAKKTSSLSLNMNLDFGSDDKITAEVQSRTAKLLHTYENLFNRLKMSGTLDSNMQGYFDNFDINQYDNMNAKIAAYKNFITEMREMSKQQFGKDYLYSDIEKSYYSAVSGAQRSLNNVIKSESTSNNSIENLFGKTDLSEVISQLTIIVNKLDEISASANNFTNIFKNGLDVNTSIQEVIDLTNRVKELETELAKIKNATPTTVSSEQKKDAFPDQDVSASVESVTNSIKEENNALEQNTQKVKENTQAKEQNANVNLNKYDKRLDSYQGKINKYDTTIKRFEDGGWSSDTYLKNVQAVRDAVKEYATLLDHIKTNQNGIASDEDIQNLDKYEKKIKDTIATVTNMSASEKGYTKLAGQKEIDKINQILRENSAMSSEAKAKIKAYKQELISGNPSTSLEKIHGEIMKIVNAEELAGRAGRSFFDTLKNSGFHQIAAQMAGMFGFYDVINLGKEAISTIVSLDDALVDLKKTTAMNSTQLEQYYYDANDVAKQMGVTTEEIINQSSAWSRLGYNTAEASTEMAKLSSQFASISPGMEVDDAQSGLVSIMKAWSIDPDQVKSEIMDPINQLGNTMAEDNQDIVEGMERSAAALAAVGTSTKDAFALFSGIQEVLQNAEKSGTSLRSVALRLRSFDETTEEYSSDLANITGELIDLTKTAEHAEGVSIFKPGSTTEFKDLTDYFREIAGIWDEMTQKQQNDFLIKAFGRNQAQAGAALIQNFEAVDKALAEIGESAGSSDKEMEAVESSLSYKINALKETWVGCVQDMIDRGDLGTIVTGLTKVSEAITFLLDKLGILGSIGLGAGIFSGIKNVGRDKMYSLSF